MLGLSPGAETCTPETRTESDRAIMKCICWAFWMVRPFTFIAELESIVSACNKSWGVKILFGDPSLIWSA